MNVPAGHMLAGVRRAPSDPPPRVDPLETLGTHDSRFGRGFEVGYAQAQIDRRESFSRWVIAAHVSELRALLEAAGAVVSDGPTERRGPFCVEFRLLVAVWVP